LVAREVDDYSGAEGTLSFGDRLTDSASRPGDQSNFSTEVRHRTTRASGDMSGSEHHAAGRFDALPGHPVIVVAQQRGDPGTGGLRSSDPAGRRPPCDKLVDSRVVPHDAAAEVGGDGARRNRVDGYAAGTQFLGKVAREHLQCALQRGNHVIPPAPTPP